MPGDGLTVGICPVGEIDTLYPKIIAAHIAGYLNLPSRILKPVSCPASAFEKNRMQYDAGRVLAHLEHIARSDCTKLIGITAVDLFVPIFTHVFGEACQGGRAALVSTFRLAGPAKNDGASPALIYERTAKVALHELGHLFNLTHCDDQLCLMHFAGDLEELDNSRIGFCRYCRAYFRDALTR